MKIRNEPNTLCWSELTTKDPKAAEAFYVGMFGWVPKHSGNAAVMEYTEFSVNGQPSVGMMGMPQKTRAQANGGASRSPRSETAPSAPTRPPAPIAAAR